MDNPARHSGGQHFSQLAMRWPVAAAFCLRSLARLRAISCFASEISYNWSASGVAGLDMSAEVEAHCVLRVPLPKSKRDCLVRYCALSGRSPSSWGRGRHSGQKLRPAVRWIALRVSHCCLLAGTAIEMEARVLRALLRVTIAGPLRSLDHRCPFYGSWAPTRL